MTAPNDERIKALKAFFGQQLGDSLAMDAQQAKEADPTSLVQPIYVGKLIEPYYRDLLSVLSSHASMREELEKVKGERDRFKVRVKQLERGYDELKGLAGKLKAELTALRREAKSAKGEGE